MKFLIMLLLSALLAVSCSERVVYADRPAVVAGEPMPDALYSNCYVPGRGFLSDTGRYHPHGSTYRCNGVVYRSGVPYHGSLLGALAIGYYFSSLGRGYGNYGMYHNNVTNVTNVTVYKKGSSGYKSRSSRYSKIQKTRNKNKWVSKSEKKRRSVQSKKAKKAHKKKMAAKRSKSKTVSSRSSSKSRSNSYKAKPTRTRSKSSSSSWGRSSSRSSSRRSGGRRRSDLRLKNTITPIFNALAAVRSIRGVRYYYNGSKDLQVGVIAQEVEKVIPEAVHMNDDGYRSVSYDLLVPLLIEAIKEQQLQIEELKAKR